MTKTALQREMDSFFKELANDDFLIRNVTKSGFSKSRRHLKPEAFLELNDLVCNDFYDKVEYLGYNNHRVLAIDGTTLTLPNHSSVEQEFPSVGFGPEGKSDRNKAIMSLLYDVGNCLTLDVQLTHYKGSERELLLAHLEKLEAGDLLLLDRGYPSLLIMSLLQSRDIHFCMRMVENKPWKEVERFISEDIDEKDVVFRLPNDQMRSYSKQYPDLKTEIPCRLVRVKLDNGEYEILCTSLMDREQYPFEEFRELYHLRWGVEESYKLYKERAGLEKFSGKTARAVKQDIYATVFMMSLCAAFAFPIEQRVRKEYAVSKTRKHQQKINRTNALAFTRSMVIPLFLKGKIEQALSAFDDNVSNTRELERPGRSNPRNKRKKQPPSMNYKDL